MSVSPAIKARAYKLTSAIALISSIGTIIGFTIVDYKNAKKPPVEDPNLKAKKDGFVEFQVKDKGIVKITETELDLRYKKIMLEREISGLREEIDQLKDKIKIVKDRTVGIYEESFTFSRPSLRTKSAPNKS
ncbi:hypothetical protein DSO57_1036871 [Entomophthora muscae]|uniref:Uncharacterized protein n=2 Tax=Entomophthora muscae TaxID=34485 RepID=A0ACC2T9T7_9FUNG|nr:hypothetical protein DSO57_1027182 [Entomophthora muscae]KAJ9071438.1 hypothetical protein DSO57_1036871 [Entomophthora muscae]